MKDITGQARYHAITHFNSEFYKLHSNIPSVYSAVAYEENISTCQDTFLHKAIKTLQSTEWKEVYGLDLIQTMDLDYSTYLLLEKNIKAYKTASDAATNIVKDQLRLT